jgi:hypothetical protein
MRLITRRAALAGTLLAAPIAACASKRSGEFSPAPLSAPIARNVTLILPTPPGYPRARRVLQTIVGLYGERSSAFEAVVSLSPDLVELVLALPSGPRIANIRWSKDGVEFDRSRMAPPELKAENVLGDLFLCQWPVAAIEAALPPGATLRVDGESRVVLAGDRVLVEVGVEITADGESRQSLRNADFDYSLRIVTQDLG